MRYIQKGFILGSAQGKTRNVKAGNLVMHNASDGLSSDDTDADTGKRSKPGRIRRALKSTINFIIDLLP
ncbi:hypothetical protein [Tropheryma whipplei]|uniref:hypothetical protein n=1 Tax=Tropheryma whipplei TaxID=2039 RepID=UPI000320EF89|nr:hypothetical protein [Tropheryma whipplei]